MVYSEELDIVWSSFAKVQTPLSRAFLPVAFLWGRGRGGEGGQLRGRKTLYSMWRIEVDRMVVEFWPGLELRQFIFTNSETCYSIVRIIQSSWVIAVHKYTHSCT